jgi:hypothetical protein
MADDLGCELAQRAAQVGRVDDVDLLELRACIDVLAPASGEFVDHDDFVAERDERVDHVRADEPGTSRDDDAAAGHGAEVCLTP